MLDETRGERDGEEMGMKWNRVGGEGNENKLESVESRRGRRARGIGKLRMWIKTKQEG